MLFLKFGMNRSILVATICENFNYSKATFFQIKQLICTSKLILTMGHFKRLNTIKTTKILLLNHEAKSYVVILQLWENLCQLKLKQCCV